MNDERQNYSVVVSLLACDAHVVEVMRGVKRPDVIIHRDWSVNVTCAGTDVGADDFFADGGWPSVFDVHAGDFDVARLSQSVERRGEGGSEEKRKQQRAVFGVVNLEHLRR